MEPTYFASSAAFRAWLEEHHARAPELVLGFYKKHTKHDGLGYPDAVLEALCFGWIDGKAKSIDDDRFCIRFTPRRPRSIWSRVNIARVEALEREGRMTDAGRAAFAAKTADRTDVYSYEQPEAELDDEFAAKLRANAAAYDFFFAQPPSYRRLAKYWVTSAKKHETRVSRLERLIERSAAGERLPQFVSPGRKPASKPESVRPASKPESARKPASKPESARKPATKSESARKPASASKSATRGDTPRGGAGGRRRTTR